MDRLKRTVIIVDYCKYHRFSHPFAVTEDTKMEGRPYPILLIDLAESEGELYDASFVVMEHKRDLLDEVRGWRVKNLRWK